MVNNDFDKFRKEQHKGTYLGGTRKQSKNNNSDYNSREDTDKSPGATGRK